MEQTYLGNPNLKSECPTRSGLKKRYLNTKGV